jgi:hypothetical protein
MTRLDSGWNFRAAYDSARKLRDAQDAFCAKVESSSWDDLAGKTFPEDLQWESLVDVLRGRVKLSVHCYEAVDLDGIVRVRFFVHMIFGCLMDALGQLTNEFEFPVASFHHAGETYLVPELLKKTWVSLFSFLVTRLRHLLMTFISTRGAHLPSRSLRPIFGTYMWVDLCNCADTAGFREGRNARHIEDRNSLRGCWQSMESTLL